MLIVNKTGQRIGSHHGNFNLRPGSNDVDASKLTKSERAMLDALERERVIERVEPPPESGKQAIPVESSPILETIVEPAPARQLKKRRAKR